MLINKQENVILVKIEKQPLLALKRAFKICSTNVKQSNQDDFWQRVNQIGLAEMFWRTN